MTRPTGAALVIGASADYGAGYFSSRHDALERITLTGPGTTPPTTTTIAPTTTTVPPTTVYPPSSPTSGGRRQPATAGNDGSPLIRQIRNGVVISMYNKLGGYCSILIENQQDNPSTECGPFIRENYTKMRNGDVFEVYPALYEGLDQQPYFGPTADNYANFLAGIQTVKRNITVREITVNAKRPVIRLGASTGSNTTLGQGLVYVDTSENITIENIDVDGTRTGTGTLGKAGIYLVGGANLTLRTMLEGNYFRKTTPAPGFPFAESYLVDIPERRPTSALSTRSVDRPRGRDQPVPLHGLVVAQPRASLVRIQ